MRLLPTLSAGILAAIGVFLIAPSARADGFFITLSGGVTTARTWGAVYDSTSSVPIRVSSQGTYAGPAQLVPVHIEIDEWSTAATFINATMTPPTGTPVNVTIDFTKPGTNGVEQTYLTATFRDAHFTRWHGKYVAGASTPLTETIEFITETQPAYTSPPAPATTAAATPAAPVAPMRLIRPAVMPKYSILATIQPPQVGDVYLVAATPATNARVTSADVGLAYASVSGSTINGQPRFELASFKVEQWNVVKVPDASTSTFSQALASRASNPAALNFVQHRPGLPDATLFTIKASAALVSADNVAVTAGVSTEAVSIAPSGTPPTQSVVFTNVLMSQSATY